jgi:hypothetical protein
MHANKQVAGCASDRCHARYVGSHGEGTGFGIAIEIQIGFGLGIEMRRHSAANHLAGVDSNTLLDAFVIELAQVHWRRIFA